MNIPLILRHARKWALHEIEFSINGNVHLYMNVKDIPQDYLFFLKEVPRRWGFCKLENWWEKEEGDCIIFNRDVSGPIINAHIQIFEHKDSAYAALYDDNGKRMTDHCLVIWDKSKPDVNNPGYAPGRCPDTIDNFSNDVLVRPS